MLLKGSGFCASWCGTPGSVVTCRGKCQTWHFQHEHHWEQAAPQERHPWSSLRQLCPFCHSITGYTSLCALAFTQTQKQTRFSEAAANPGLGRKHSSPSWERSWEAYSRRKQFEGDFSMMWPQRSIFPIIWLLSLETHAAEKASDLLQFYRCVYLFISSSGFW